MPQGPVLEERVYFWAKNDRGNMVCECFTRTREVGELIERDGQWYAVTHDGRVLGPFAEMSGASDAIVDYDNRANPRILEKFRRAS